MNRIIPQDGIAVVTGAGSGLGRALVIELASRGFTVVGVGRRSAALEETRALAGGSVHVAPLDVAKFDDVIAEFARIEDTFGPVALLINNAAIYPHRDILDETPESFMHSVNVNLGGTLACSHAALKGMVTRGQGRILNVATYADIAPLPASAAYSVSKGAARILTRALVADLADRFPDIVIGDWMPGMLRTGMGIPGGLPPQVSAKWGVELALMRDPGLTGTTFEQNREVLPPQGLKSKVKSLVLMRRRRPRTIG